MNANLDQAALDLARRYTPDAQYRLRNSLQCEVIALVHHFTAAPAPAVAREAVECRPCCQPEDLSDYIHVSVLRGQLMVYADQACRECEGSGVYYGNVCVCGCILDALPMSAVEAQGERVQGEACPCGKASCVEPWEPGCGLGTSAEHAQVAAEPARGGEDER